MLKIRKEKEMRKLRRDILRATARKIGVKPSKYVREEWRKIQEAKGKKNE